MTAFSCAQYWVSESDVSRTVVEVSSIEPAQNMQSIVVYIALSCSTRWRGCLALLNINGSLWQLLQPGCITRRGKWVLTDVDTYIRACTSCTQSYVELAASAAGRECQQWLWSSVCLLSMIRAAELSTFCSGRKWTAMTLTLTLSLKLLLSNCYMTDNDDSVWNCRISLWSPYVIRQTIIFLPCDFYLFFIPRLISAAADWMSTILLHMAWP